MNSKGTHWPPTDVITQLSVATYAISEFFVSPLQTCKTLLSVSTSTSFWHQLETISKAVKQECTELSNPAIYGFIFFVKGYSTVLWSAYPLVIIDRWLRRTVIKCIAPYICTPTSTNNGLANASPRAATNDQLHVLYSTEAGSQGMQLTVSQSPYAFLSISAAESIAALISDLVCTTIFNPLNLVRIRMILESKSQMDRYYSVSVGLYRLWQTNGLFVGLPIALATRTIDHIVRWICSGCIGLIDNVSHKLNPNATPISENPVVQEIIPRIVANFATVPLVALRNRHIIDRLQLRSSSSTQHQTRGIVIDLVDLYRNIGWGGLYNSLLFECATTVVTHLTVSKVFDMMKNWFVSLERKARRTHTTKTSDLTTNEESTQLDSITETDKDKTKRKTRKKWIRRWVILTVGGCITTATLFCECLSQVNMLLNLVNK